MNREHAAPAAGGVAAWATELRLRPAARINRSEDPYPERVAAQHEAIAEMLERIGGEVAPERLDGDEVARRWLSLGEEFPGILAEQ